MICFGHRSILHKKKSQLASNFKLTRTPTIRRAWSNSSYTIMAKPIKMLELHYQMIQFLKIIIIMIIMIRLMRSNKMGDSSHSYWKYNVAYWHFRIEKRMFCSWNVPHICFWDHYREQARQLNVLANFSSCPK